jgi:hypothetical protein
VDATLAKLVVAADMVEMGVARDTDEGALLDERHMLAQAEMAEAGVDEQIPVAAADVPDVAAEEGFDPRLVDQRHAVGETYHLVPVGRGYGVGGQGVTSTE